MAVAALRVWNFRNYEEAEFRPAPALTVVAGDNGAGKSSLLEACVMFSTLASPRAGQMSVVVRDGTDEGGAHLEQSTGVPLEIRIRGGRSHLRAAGSGCHAKDFLGRFRSVLFTPEDLDLVRGDPDGRRRAVDELIVQIRPVYRSVRQDFDRALRQRNSALRQGRPDDAAVYNRPLAAAAAQVLQARREAVREIEPHAVRLYDALAGRGSLALRYRDTSGDDGLTGAALADHFESLYERNLDVELERGVTRAGPHRDDLEIEVDGRPARSHASRGEQRSAALAFRLSELELLPGAVLLLDDVLSELDPDRRRRVFDAAGRRQTIVTATERETVPIAPDAAWWVKDGSLIEG